MALPNKPLSSIQVQLVLFLTLILMASILSTANTFPENRHNKLWFDYMFQFGDSLSDTGNLIRDNPIGSHSPFTHFPYGQTIHHSTGRCSDGLLMVDFFAKFFHLPLLSPYLDTQANFTHGVNFAVAGSTALDTSTLRDKAIVSPVTNSSLSVQLTWLKSHLDSLCSTTTTTSSSKLCKERIVRNSLILMGEVGGNDYNYALLQAKPMQEVYDLVPQVVQSIKDAVKEVIKLGAIRVVVPGNFPIGCLPVYLATFEQSDPTKYDELHCLRDLNSFAQYHNDHLQKAIKELQQEYPGVGVVYGDYYSGLRWILKNAVALGFEKDNLQKTCCGNGDNKYNFNLTRICGYQESSSSSSACDNPNQRLSWDGVHLTQHAYLHMAQWLLRKFVPAILRLV